MAVDGIVGYTLPKPMSANHHFNIASLYSIKQITDFQANQVGWNNKECMAIGLASLGNVKMKSKLLNSYDSSLKQLIDDPKSRIYFAPNFSKTVSPSYANFFLSDFYFQFGKLVKDVVDGGYGQSVGSVYFPEGVYNFMATYYGTTNIFQIKRVLQTSKPTCQGGGMTPEQAHNVISTLTFISAFIPFVGPFIAAGLGTADAAILWSEGKKGEAALTAALSLIPFAAEIPALKGVGQEVFQSIATKTISKIPLNPSELEVVGKITNAKGEFDAVAKKWIASKTSNPVVQEFTNIVKKKGEAAIANKIEDAIGVPITKKQVTSKAKDYAKHYATDLAKQYNT